MSKLTIRVRPTGNITVLDLEGNLRLGEGNVELHNAIRSLVEKGQKNIILNLENVFSIDSSGLGELVASYVAVTKSDGKIKILHLSKRARELMFMTKLLTIFDVFENEQEAVKSFKVTSGKPEKQQQSVESGLL
jgi:anti-sigma B factor antagonist